MLVYDNTKNTILEGFGITPERQTELVEEYIHGSRGDILERICNDETLPPNEKCLLLVDLGTKLVTDTVNRLIEEHGQAPDSVT